MPRRMITRPGVGKSKGSNKAPMETFFSLLSRSCILLLAFSIYVYDPGAQALEREQGNSLPDLTGQWMSLSQSCKSTKRGSKCNITGILNIQNIGTQKAPSSFVHFYFSKDGDYNGTNTFLKKTSTGTIKAGAGSNKKLSYNFPSGQTATCNYIIAVIDESNSVQENNEANNIIISERILPDVQPDYSGMYYLAVGGDPKVTMTLEQSNHDIAFRVERSGLPKGGGFPFEGTGKVCGATLEGKAVIEGMGVFIMVLTFSNNGQSFYGTFEMVGDVPFQGSITGSKNSPSTYDVKQNGIPQFMTKDCIELDKIQKVSKFRSGAGHDFSDDFETCRSMKHYFFTKEGVDMPSVKLFSPVNGRVVALVDEWENLDLWKGTQVNIVPNGYEAFWVVIFHINLNHPLQVGDEVAAGQELGRSAKISGTVADIAVWVNTPKGGKLISYFEAMTDSVFQDYQARGLKSRYDAIISKDERDADPLTCNGDPGHLENWVILD